MDEELKEYNYKSALAMLKGVSFYGKPINIEDTKEVIAVLYSMYLLADQEFKEQKREQEFLFGT